MNPRSPLRVIPVAITSPAELRQALRALSGLAGEHGPLPLLLMDARLLARSTLKMK